jgi:negative modulator of initiation of replication
VKLPVETFVLSDEFRFAKGVVGRFLATLSWLYAAHKDDFQAVERIRGRGRLYFAKSAEALEQSGRSVNPKQIPGSPYWVITTTSTDLKQEILFEVMKVLKYDAPSIRIAVEAIAV